MARGSITRRDSGRWSIRYDLPPGPVTGRRRQRRETVHGIKRDAESLLARRIREVSEGTHVEPEKIIVAQYLRRWLDQYVDTNLRQTTAVSYRERVANHIIPALGAVRLDRLTPAHLQALYAEKLKDGRLDGKPGGLSPRSVQYIHSILHRALEHAVQWQVLSRNQATAGHTTTASAGGDALPDP